MIEKQELSELPSQHNTKLTVRGAKINNYFFLEDIVYIEADGHYSWFYFKDQTRFLSSKTLRHYQELLQESGFIRISKFYVINKLHLLHYHIKANQVVLTGNIKLRVSVRRRKGLEFL